MADLLALERLCKDLPVQIDRAANVLAVRATEAIDVDLVEHTPVDTTEAVSNWQAGINASPNYPLPPIFPGEKGSTAPQSRREAIAHVQRALKDKDPGAPVYLSNVAEHIVDLNNGTSKQEPAGFVERAIAVGGAAVDRIGLEIKA